MRLMGIFTIDNIEVTYHRNYLSSQSSFTFTVLTWVQKRGVALVVTNLPISQISKIKGSNIVSDKVVTQFLSDHLYLN